MRRFLTQKRCFRHKNTITNSGSVKAFETSKPRDKIFKYVHHYVKHRRGKMTKLFSLKDLPTTEKILLLNKLGYGSDGTYVTNANGKKKIKDIYTNQTIKLDNMLILSGSTIILDNNPLSIASYLEEYPNAL